MTQVDVHSDIPLADCRGRLSDALLPLSESRRWSLGLEDGDWRLIGFRIGSSWFYVKRAKEQRNAFSPVFLGKLSESTTGTLLRGWITMNPFYMAALIGWFVGLAVFVGKALSATLPLAGKAGFSGIALLLWSFPLFLMLPNRSKKKEALNVALRRVLASPQLG